MVLLGHGPIRPNAGRCGAIDSEGIFGANIAYKVSDVTDGTANTIFVGEVSRFVNEPNNSPFNFGNVGAGFPGPDWSSTTFWSGDTRPTSGAYSTPIINAAAVTSNVTACMAGNPSGVPQYGNTVGWTLTCQYLGQFGFRSMQSGGANFMFGDGSVHFLKQTINLNIYRGLSMRNLGEVISSDAD